MTFDRFPVIVGPTAGGKSSLAVAVAHTLAGMGVGSEIVTADSVQVYRGLDIGSAKPTLAQQEGIPHHLIDLCEPDGPSFTVVDWLRDAERAISEIRARGNVPIVVGGTHLYVKAFLEGMFEGPGTDESLREELRAMGLPALRAELERVDPEAAARIHPNDERRTVRALEVFRLTGLPISGHQGQWDQGGKPRDDCVLVGLDWPSEAINPRINARVREMVALGLVEEVRSLHAAKRLGAQAREALGYKQIVAHLEGRCSLDEAIEKTKIETRRFGKNQRTWLKRLRMTRGSVWIDASSTPVERWAGIVIAAMQAER
jgi:tRNA dimethylallyltransferase